MVGANMAGCNFVGASLWVQVWMGATAVGATVVGANAGSPAKSETLATIYIYVCQSYDYFL